MKTFTSGALSSEEAPRFDLIPLASLQRQAARMALGAESRPEWNYRQGAHDPAFIRDRINHMVQHAIAYANGQTDDDHLGGVLGNAGMLADLEALRSGFQNPEREDSAVFSSHEQPAIPNGKPAHDERHSHATPATCGCPVVTYPPGPCIPCDQKRRKPIVR